MGTCPWPEGCTVVRNHEAASRCRVNIKRTSRLLLRTNFTVSTVPAHWPFSVCDHVGGEWVGEIPHTCDKGKRYYPAAANEKEGRHKPAWEAPRYLKLQRNGRTHQSPPFSSAENLKSCDRDTLADFCRLCFPQWLYKHGEKLTLEKERLWVHSELPRKKKGSVMTSFNGSISWATLLHS